MGLVVLEMIIYYFIASILFFGYQFEKGLPDLRDPRMAVARQQTRFGTKLAMRMCGFRVKVIGKAAPVRHGISAPIISNHISYADVTMLARQGHTGFVAKAGIKKAPIFRSIAFLWNVVFVKRKSTDSRKSIQDTLSQRCSNPQLPTPTVFVEGTTTNGRWLMQFRPGIFRLAKPVQPVLLTYPHKHASVAWDTCTISFSMMRALSQFIIPAELHYLPLYIPNEAEEADAVLYAENVRQAMAEYAAEHGLNIRLTEANVMEKLIYQDYCDGKITWGKLLRDLEALYGGDNAARFTKERVGAFRKVCEASGYTPFKDEEQPDNMV